MIKWTTPSLVCTIPEGIEFDYILLTLKQEGITIEKRIEATQVLDNTFSAFFTQEETAQLSSIKPVLAQLNIIDGAIRLATNIINLNVSPNLHEAYIEETV